MQLKWQKSALHHIDRTELLVFGQANIGVSIFRLFRKYRMRSWFGNPPAQLGWYVQFFGRSRHLAGARSAKDAKAMAMKMLQTEFIDVVRELEGA